MPIFGSPSMHRITSDSGMSEIIPALIARAGPKAVMPSVERSSILLFNNLKSI